MELNDIKVGWNLAGYKLVHMQRETAGCHPEYRTLHTLWQPSSKATGIGQFEKELRIRLPYEINQIEPPRNPMLISTPGGYIWIGIQPRPCDIT